MLSDDRNQSTVLACRIAGELYNHALQWENDYKRRNSGTSTHLDPLSLERFATFNLQAEVDLQLLCTADLSSML